MIGSCGLSEGYAGDGGQMLESWGRLERRLRIVESRGRSWRLLRGTRRDDFIRRFVMTKRWRILAAAVAGSTLGLWTTTNSVFGQAASSGTSGGTSTGATSSGGTSGSSTATDANGTAGSSASSGGQTGSIIGTSGGTTGTGS